MARLGSGGFLMTVHSLSAEAIATISKPPSRELVLVRARVHSAALRLLLLQIEEIGISAKEGWVTPDEALQELATFEPVLMEALLAAGNVG
jgi:hypothetical protein